MNFVYGPVPSRRLGLSLGISPLPRKTCNYACIYCQLGRTNPLTIMRGQFYLVEAILAELKQVLSHAELSYDIITIVGEGEPTLFADLELLIDGIKALTSKPIAVITNGALLSDEQVVQALLKADFVLPSLDAVNEKQFKQINRPHGSISYQEVLQGLIDFSKRYPGQLWLEIMFVKGFNDDAATLQKMAELLKMIRYDRLFLNTPVRPPAEPEAEAATPEFMEKASILLGGIAIDLLSSAGFYSEATDDFEAVISTIQRHPMNQFEILDFLKSRKCSKPEVLLAKLNADPAVECIYYKGYNTYRLKVRNPKSYSQ